MVKKRTSKRLKAINYKGKMRRQQRMNKILKNYSLVVNELTLKSPTVYNQILVHYKGCYIPIKDYIITLKSTLKSDNIASVPIKTLSVIPYLSNKFCELPHFLYNDETEILNELNSTIIQNQIRKICDQT